jgi:hypothetical protein
MTAARQRLPNRRAHEALRFQHGGQRYHAGLGRFSDGRLAEIFLNSAKAGTDLATAARDAAIVCSLAFQHGATVEEVRCALSRNSDGSASGPLGALLDIVAAEGNE